MKQNKSKLLNKRLDIKLENPIHWRSMQMKVLKAIIVVLLVTATPFLFGDGGNAKSIDISRISERVSIDGDLSEPIYAQIAPAEDFYQFHPKNGAKPTFKTQVYSFYDRNNIYFAFKCFDKDPGSIAGDVTPFGDYSNNDEIKIYIDTFLDKQTYKLFAVNPKGIKKGEQTVWDASARITDYGWSAEFKIPFKSLRFPVRGIQEWTVNFERFIFRLNETNYWTNVTRDRMTVFGDTFGQLKGIKDIKGGKNVEIYPYAGYRTSTSGDETDDKFAYGVDLKYGITSNLTLDLTTSPDYSEVESDPFFYQLEPYEVNLQENRPFYYESSGYFSTPFQLFYSRRVTDPTFAAKVTGKEKGFSLGALLAKNETGDADSYHGVFRLKKDIFKLSSVGVMYSSIEEEGNWNRNAGLDFNLTLKDIYSISGMVAYSYNKGFSQSDNGMYYLQFARSVDKGLNVSGWYKRVEPNVYVPAGYLRKVGYDQFHGNVFYSVRWEGKWIEKLIMQCEATAETAIETGLDTENTYFFGLQFLTRSRIWFGAGARFGKWRAQVLAPNGGLMWEAERYQQKYYYMALSYSGSPVVSFGADIVYWDDFVYSNDFTSTKPGKKSYITLWSNVKISPQMQVNLSYSNSFNESDDETIHFNGHLVSSRLNYQISKTLSSFLLFQYDSSQERFQYDFIIGYEPANVSKIVLSIKNYSENQFRLFDPDGRSITFKVSYLYRF